MSLCFLIKIMMTNEENLLFSQNIYCLIVYLKKTLYSKDWSIFAIVFPENFNT